MTSKKKEASEKYKTANYYAKAVVLGLLFWFALMFALYLSGYSTQITNALGEANQILFIAILLVVCLSIGYLINKLTWKHLLANRL